MLRTSHSGVRGRWVALLVAAASACGNSSADGADAGVDTSLGGGDDASAFADGADATDAIDAIDATALPDLGGVSDADPSADFLSTEVLGHPTASSVAVTAVPQKELVVLFEYGIASGTYTARTPSATRVAGAPFQATLDGLAADTRYFYRMRWSAPGAATLAAGPEHSFRTARAKGAPFTFTLHADPHLDENSSLDLYRRTLANELLDAPDFLVDLGDTFMCEKHSVPLSAVVQMAPDAPTVRARYLYEHVNYATVAHSAPLFLVNGNHEGESGWFLNGTADNLAIWTAQARKDFFAVPLPDSFFSGSTTNEPFVGPRGAYYAWEWGDAQFIVLDPYWYTTSMSKANGWAWTLGKEQYQWLATTLQKSTAPFRFVFIHHLVGGLDTDARGGVEAAPLYEWGGANADGTAGFAANRPGWAKPIHQLLVDNHVTALFHGHDHLYAKQSLDGLVYQEVAQPSAVNMNSGPNLATSYHYASGVIASSTGHLRISVSSGSTKVEYVRAYLPANETATAHNRDVAQTYSMSPR